MRMRSVAVLLLIMTLFSACAPAKRGVAVLLDEAFAALYPELARALAGRDGVGMPLRDARAAFARAAGGQDTAPAFRAVITSPLVASPLAEGPDADIPIIVPSGFDFQAAYAQAGRMMGSRIAALRRSGDFGARAILLFSASETRPSLLESVFSQSFGDEGLAIVPVDTDPAKTRDPEGALRLALSRAMDDKVRLVMLAVDESAFALACLKDWPKVSFGFDSGLRDIGEFTDMGFALVAGGRHAELARACLAAARLSRSGVIEARAPARIAGTLR